MSFRGPNVKRLLGKIPRIGFRMCEAHREFEKRLVVLADDGLKLIRWIHMPVL